MNEKLGKTDILKKIERGQISSEEGLRMLQSLRRSSASANGELVYFRQEWKPSGTGEASGLPFPYGTVVLFDQDEILFQAWNSGIAKANVILVQPGDAFAKLSDSRYQLHPTDPSGYQKLLQQLESKEPCCWLHRGLWPNESNGLNGENGLNAALDGGIRSVHLLVKALLGKRLNKKVHVFSLHQSQNDAAGQALGAAVGGFAKSVRLEQPLLLCKAVEIADADAASLWDVVVRETQPETEEDTEVRYAGGQRQVRALGELVNHQAAPNAGATVLRQNGVYLITGGMGGLGMLFAEHLAKKVQATLILTGRSPLHAAGEQKLQQLNKSGAQAVYMQADISKRDEVEKLLADVRARFGGLHGILHSAGVLRDSFLIKKTAEEFDSVLAPKVYGAVHLDAATREDRLDFLALFSSTTSVLGNVGQADYAYANAFLDHLADLRSQAGANVVSINWPLWHEGGMHVGAETEAYLQSAFGIMPLGTAQGLRAFEDSLTLGTSQVIVLEGQAEKIKQSLLKTASAARSNEPQNLTETDVKSMKPKMEGFLKEVLSQEMKLPTQRIHSQEPLEKYGIDSVVILNVTRELEERFGPLSKTLFFEYQNVEDLADYFVEHHPEQARIIAGVEVSVPSSNVLPPQPVREERKESASARPRFFDQPQKLTHSEAMQAEDDIAIIGLSGRYPQARTLEEFWENLKQGKDSVTEIPEARWDYRLDYDPNKEQKGKSYSKWGGFLDDVDKFDPLFFNISPREAETIDPQERLFLETAWHTLEDAGYTKAKLSRSVVGVYVGVMYGHYQLYGVEESMKGNPMALSSSYAAIANRVSYTLNLQGPSLAVDTMCSSSLTALHLACESLRHGECDMALAGGVNVSIHPNKYILLSSGKFPSSDGRCRSFGEGGDGYVPGEGVGAVLLKPLKKALQDGDHIHAVIKGTALNHGGKTNGFSVPNPNAQADVIAKTLKKAKIDARTISYVEAHGTGTALGDPIEITGLSKVFGQHTKDKQFCAIGSVKSNIGHLESAAGIAGLTKVLLQMKHRRLVPSLHASTLNPNIDFDASPFFVQREASDWPQLTLLENGKETVYPRRAALSSFGAGGSNAHVLVEEYVQPQLPTQSAQGQPQLIVLSAKNATRLREAAANLLAFAEATEEGLDLSAVAYTLQTGREAMEERLAFVATSVQELCQKIRQFLDGKADRSEIAHGHVKKHAVQNELLLEEEEGQIFLQSLIRKGKIDKLAHLWVTGVELDFALFPKTTTRIVSLPLYPFARDRCWFQQTNGTVSVTQGQTTGAGFNEEQGQHQGAGHAVTSIRPAANASVEMKNESVHRLLVKTWNLDDTTTQAQNASGRVIVLVNAETAKVAEFLQQKTAGLTFQVVDADAFAYEEAKGREVAASILETKDAFFGLIDLSDLHTESISVCQAQFGKIFFLQTLLKEFRKEPFHLLHVTHGLQSFQAGDLTLAGAEMAGLVKMLGAEYRNLWAKTVDLDLVPAQADEIAEIALHELTRQDVVGEVCYRQGRRYLPEMIEGKTAESAVPAINPQQVYVLTGGTRGIGYEMAKHLVHKGARKLVLMGVQPYPPRNEWEKIAQDRNTDVRLLNRLDAIQALEAKGVQVVTYAGSLTERDRLRAFFADVRVKLGTIGGVIHCAGLASSENPAFLSKTQDEMSRVFEPKLDGVQVLHELFAADALDFFVLVSSISGTVPALAPGGSDYAAANAFLDTFAAYQRSRSFKRYLSIQWPNWKEVGMGEVTGPIYSQLGLQALTTAEGLALLDLAMQQTHVACVMPVSLQTHAWEWDAKVLLRTKLEKQEQRQTQLQTPLQALAKAPTAQSSAVKQTPVAASVVKAKPKDTMKRLKMLFAEELKIPLEDLDEETPFGDFGVDSILLTDLVKKVEAWFGQKMDPSLFLEYPTFQSLSRHLDENYSLVEVEQEEVASGIEGAACANGESVANQSAVLLGESGISNNHSAVLLRESGVPYNHSDVALYETVVPFAQTAVTTEENTGAFQNSSPRTEVTPATPTDSVPNSNRESVLSLSAHPVQAAPERMSSNKIAVIGMACHFPGAVDLDAFWHNLSHGISSVIEVPKSRWDVDKYYSPVPQPGKSISKWGGFIDGIEWFDPSYFQLSDADAPHFDPLIRQFLEVSVQTLRHAGYDKKDLWNRKVGVFVGSRIGNYSERIKNSMKNTVTGLGQNFIAAHVSHFFNFKGPNLVVDTACSSSLVSIHLACHSLMTGESEIAMAGGVDILLDEKTYLGLSEGKALSPDGTCHTFDEKANGFVPGEGAGAVLLKPLEKALADGDTIYAVIDATAVNNDGHTMGITTPNPEMQSAVILDALEKGGLRADSISYVETHGTGTMIGDPIELKALTRVYRQFTEDTQFCGVGSVKTNFGHLLSAAGIASFIKVVLSIWHKQLPPTLNCDKPNPRFEFAKSPFYPNTTLTPWQPRAGVRRAGISSFGFGGTNAHVIVGEPEPSLLALYQPKRTPLPLVKFNRSRYWIESEGKTALETPATDLTRESVPEQRNSLLLKLEKIR